MTCNTLGNPLAFRAATAEASLLTTSYYWKETAWLTLSSADYGAYIAIRNGSASYTTSITGATIILSYNTF